MVVTAFWLNRNLKKKYILSELITELDTSFCGYYAGV